MKLPIFFYKLVNLGWFPAVNLLSLKNDLNTFLPDTWYLVTIMMWHQDVTRWSAEGHILWDQMSPEVSSISWYVKHILTRCDIVKLLWRH